MATLHPLVAGRLGRWRNAVAPVTVDGAPVDRCPDTPTAELRAGVLAAIADLHRFVAPLDRGVAGQLEHWRRAVWLASDGQVRACHETWAAQIVRCVASIRTVGGDVLMPPSAWTPPTRRVKMADPIAPLQALVAYARAWAVERATEAAQRITPDLVADLPAELLTRAAAAMRHAADVLLEEVARG